MEKNKRLVLEGGSFNPPTTAHRSIGCSLSPYFESVIIFPCGGFRPEKETTNQVYTVDRRALISLGFKNLPMNVRIDYYDLDNNVFTRNHDLQRMFEGYGEVWFAVGYDLVRGGKNNASYIHQEWERGSEMFNTLNFAVITRPGCGFDPADLPPHNMVFDFNFKGSSSEARRLAEQGMPLTGIVNKDVEKYIYKNGIYQKKYPIPIS